MIGIIQIAKQKTASEEIGQMKLVRIIDTSWYLKMANTLSVDEVKNIIKQL
jgi:hypothetical protein